MSWTDDLRDAVGAKSEYETERVLLGFTDQLNTRMESLGLSRADLARIMDVNRSRVTRLLRGEHNLTTRTLVDAALAVGCRLSLTLRPFEAAAVDEPISYTTLAPAKLSEDVALKAAEPLAETADVEAAAIPAFVQVVNRVRSNVYNFADYRAEGSATLGPSARSL